MNVSFPLYAGVDMIAALNALFWGLLLSVVVAIFLAAPLGGLSGYISIKLAIPLGVVWAILPSVLLFVLLEVSSSGGFWAQNLVFSITALTIISFKFAAAATIGALIRRICAQKKRLAELEKQLLEQFGAENE